MPAIRRPRPRRGVSPAIPRRSTRATAGRSKFDTAIKQLKDADVRGYFSPPRYQLISQQAGGEYSQATLGPACVHLFNTTSKADPKLPRAIVSARGKYPRACFKAGHLLNERFGGNGKRADNLTILTASANSQMQGFDDNVVAAVGELNNWYKAIYNHQLADGSPAIAIGKFKEINCGIKVEVWVDGRKWSDDQKWQRQRLAVRTTNARPYPEQYIANYVTCKATLVDTLPPRTPEQNAILKRVQEFIKKANGYGTNIDNRWKPSY